MAYQRIVYHAHARDRMRLRSIAEHQVLATLNRPDRLFPSHSGRLVAERDTTAGNTLRVVFVEQVGDTTAFVLTVIRRGA